MKKINYQSLYNRAYIAYWAAFDRSDTKTMDIAEKLMRGFATQLDHAPWPPLPSERRKQVKPRAKNPVPPSKNVQIKRASELYENFSGHEAEIVETLVKPIYPDVLVEIGDVDGILYTTTRDNQVEKYIHKFHKDAKPLFCASPDGAQLFFIGGEYDFTERGIVDRTDPKQQQ